LRCISDTRIQTTNPSNQDTIEEIIMDKARHSEETDGLGSR
jgi:hypothetical protein